MISRGRKKEESTGLTVGLETTKISVRRGKEFGDPFRGEA
jgi:hypothetical protein